MYTVKDVHADFEAAQDRIVDEAQRIINTPQKKLADKAKRLNALGFTSIPDALGRNSVESYIENQHNLLYSISAYQQKYPLHKFITEREVEKLCKKYGLVFGDASDFIGDIPEKNLLEIEAFTLLKEDYSIQYYLRRSHFEDQIYLGHGLGSIAYSGSYGELPEHDMYHYKPEFKMVASYDDFDTSDMTLNDYKLEKNLPDPIVLQPVRGGYLIVSKWGEEASDAIVVNEVMN